MVNYYIKIFHPFKKLGQNPLIHINLFYNSFMPFFGSSKFWLPEEGHRVAEISQVSL